MIFSRIRGLAVAGLLLLVAIASPALAAQNCLITPNTGTLAGLTFVNDQNAANTSFAGFWEGATTPTTTNTCLPSLAGFVWHDTSTGTLKVRDQADTAWILAGTFDETGKTFSPAFQAAQTYAADTGSANAYVVAPTPAWGAYVAGKYILFSATNANTTASTINVNGLGIKNLKRRDGTALQANDILAGSLNLGVYDGTNVQLLSGSLTTPVVVPGTVNGLVVTSPGVVKTASIAANQVSLSDASGNGWLASSVSVTLNLASGGAGGLDAGSVAANTWYAVFLINDGGTAKALASTSATAPTMPGTDTYKARIGWVRTDASGNILSFVQHGRKVALTVNGAYGLTVMAFGSAGTPSVGPTISIALANYVPSTAAAIHVIGICNGLASGNQEMVIAPNNLWGGDGGTPGSLPPYAACLHNTDITTLDLWIPLESTNIYWAGNGSNVGVLAAGWEDNF